MVKTNGKEEIQKLTIKCNISPLLASISFESFITLG
jgi:hypothetical protein